MTAARSSSRILTALLAFAAGTALAGPALHSAPDHSHHGATAHSAGMSDAEMARRVADYFRFHPEVTSPGGALQGVDATYTVGGTRFNADGSTSTAIDTVRIMAGQTVRWTWVSGSHTITSGTGALDPEAGMVFNVPMDTGHREFQFTFAAPETVPFFCEPHEEFGMKGVVIVQGAVGVEPGGTGAMLGFTAAPWPNPSSIGASFRFALAGPARVRSDVVDVQGRHVAFIADGEYGAGDHVLQWDGRGAQGLVPAGVYYLRLRAPGFVGSRPVTIRR